MLAARKIRILGTPVSAIAPEELLDAIASWCAQGETARVYFANAHMLMEARDDPGFSDVVSSAELVLPDGMPLVWLLRRRGFSGARRIYGPEQTLAICELAQARSIPVACVGGTVDGLSRLVSNLLKAFPRLKIAAAISPPAVFPAAGPSDDYRKQIIDSGARLVFVGLGCPKQELWIHGHSAGVPAVFLGVGAAFDFISGLKPQAPRWMRNAGLEWFFRLLTEPRRLWRRYLVLGPRFVLSLLRESRDP